MPLPSRSESFLQGHGSSFPQHDVAIVHDAGGPTEKRTKSRAIIQGASGIFDLDAPVYEGDTIEVADPRGGVREYYVKTVESTDTNGAAAFQGMSHINAVWGAKPSRRDSEGITSSHVYNAPVINIQGDRAQVAWGNKTSSQNSGSISTVTPGYEQIAAVVATALQNLQSAEMDEDDKDVAVESAEAVLREATRAEPDPKILRRGLATLKGVLGGLVVGASTGAGDAAHDWVQSTLSALAGLSLPS
ncbi:hypothetical protein [Arthrobacter sp. ISL-65]|uniref:hypothetical protein n=1 Tax=Arthrobacter sp. ISL-65 TaxID=2819112 RepID=UPI001BE6BF2E|nr:hypothetical protein [Arthrobacter sp. ISL-65]MBT2550884.1 hypothetical protein [Arthrobacter sp. ISL-65]